MLLVIIALLNWIFIKNRVIKLIIALGIFLIVESKRSKKEATGAEIAAEFISALILVSFIIMIILGIVFKVAVN